LITYQWSPVVFIYFWQTLVILQGIFWILLIIPSFFFGKKTQETKKVSKKHPKITTIASNMKGCFKFYTFIFWISPNLVKYTYRLLSLEQHHKIERKQAVCHTYGLAIYIEKHLKAKEELWKLKYFSMQKYNLQTIL
jgi:hypothetical protein